MKKRGGKRERERGVSLKCQLEDFLSVINIKCFYTPQVLLPLEGPFSLNYKYKKKRGGVFSGYGNILFLCVSIPHTLMYINMYTHISHIIIGSISILRAHLSGTRNSTGFKRVLYFIHLSRRIISCINTQTKCQGPHQKKEGGKSINKTWHS